MSLSKKKKLFKKAYLYNWDNGLEQIFGFIDDENCDKATALMIFWHGCPEYYYGKDISFFKDYEKEGFKLLKTIEARIQNNYYTEEITYQIDEDFLPKNNSNIPDFLLTETKGKIDYKEILYPNNNPFQDEILALCQNCATYTQMSELKEKGANFNLKILNGYCYPIEVAMGNGQLEAIKFFIKEGFNINKKYNRNPLFFTAISGKNLEILKLLLGNGLKINLKGEFGRNAMHRIAGLTFDSKLKEIAKVLVDNGAKVDALDSSKQTPFERAKMLNNREYMRFLRAIII